MKKASGLDGDGWNSGPLPPVTPRYPADEPFVCCFEGCSKCYAARRAAQPRLEVRIAPEQPGDGMIRTEWRYR